MMPGRAGKLLQIKKLGAPVALAERMNVIHVTNDRAGALGERGRRRVLEIIRFDSALTNVGHAGLYALAEHELMTAIVEFDGTNLAGPGVNVPEQMVVDGLQVRKIEIPGRHVLGYTICDYAAL